MNRGAKKIQNLLLERLPVRKIQFARKVLWEIHTGERKPSEIREAESSNLEVEGAGHHTCLSKPLAKDVLYEAMFATKSTRIYLLTAWLQLSTNLMCSFRCSPPAAGGFVPLL
jgi:hypothetical protein